MKISKRVVSWLLLLCLCLSSCLSLSIDAFAAGESYNPTYSSDVPSLEDILPQGAIAPIADDTYNPTYNPDTGGETPYFLPTIPTDTLRTFSLIVCESTLSNTSFVLFQSKGIPTISDSKILTFTPRDEPRVYTATMGASAWTEIGASQMLVSFDISAGKFVWSSFDLYSDTQWDTLVFPKSDFLYRFVVPSILSYGGYRYYVYLPGYGKLYFFANEPSIRQYTSPEWYIEGRYAYISYTITDGVVVWGNLAESESSGARPFLTGYSPDNSFHNFDLKSTRSGITTTYPYCDYPPPLGNGINFTPVQGGGQGSDQPTNPTNPTDPTEPTTSAADVVGDKIDGLGGKIGQFFDKLWERISGAFDGIKSAFLSLGDKLTDVKNNIVEWFQKMGGKLGELKDSFVQKIQELGTSIGNFFTALGDKIGGFFTGLWEKVVAFFKPSAGFFDQYSADFKAFAKDHFGFLVDVPELIGIVFNKLLSYSPPEVPSIMLPAASVPLPSGTIQIWEAQTYTFTILTEAPYSTLYGVYKAFVWCLFAVLLFNLGERTYNDIFGGRD